VGMACGKRGTSHGLGHVLGHMIFLVCLVGAPVAATHAPGPVHAPRSGAPALGTAPADGEPTR
jgi:hypothetical protein